MTNTFNSQSPQLRLALALIVAVVLVFLLDGIRGWWDVFQPIQEVTAWLAFVAIDAVGMPVAIDGILLTHWNGFRVAISHGCTPLIPAIFLLAVMTIGISVGMRQRLIGIISGIALVTILNLFRVAALYYIGVIAPDAFILAHEWLGQGVIVLGTAMVACYWIDASARRQQLIPAH